MWRGIGVAVALLVVVGCAGGEPTAAGDGSGGSYTGIWVRQTGDGSGDETDLAIGNILGAPANRVWACEVRPSLNFALVIRGYINGDRITWDPVHGNPDYIVSRSGSRLAVEVPTCAVCQRTLYEAGAWRSLCGELDERPTNIFVQFGVWGIGPSASITALTTPLSCVQGTVVGPVHEQCRPGQTRFTSSLRVGTQTVTSTDAPVTLARPDSGNYRYYMLGWKFQPILGRYLVANGDYVDRPEEGAQITVVAGAGQSGTPGTQLPVAPAVRIATPGGRPLPGVTVTFSVPGNDPTLYGSIEGGGDVVTGTDGIARITSWTLGSDLGQQAIRVTAPFVSGAPLNISAAVFEDSVTKVYAMRNRSCSLRKSGVAQCWGAGSLRPTLVPGSTRFTTLALTETATCGLSADGRAHCWGQGMMGELGQGAVNTFAAEPTPVSGSLTFQQLVGSEYNVCGLTAAGAAYCWGDNSNGQIGDGTTINRFTPTAVSGGHSFTKLTVGIVHACGIVVGGAARCWGGNSLPSSPTTGGQLGDGTRTRRLTPTLVSGGLTFTDISAGFAYTCGLVSGGSARCWGANFSGQIGDSLATADRLVPATVVGGRAYTSISAGGGFACAFTASGERWCWGSNTSGQFDIGFESGATTRGYPIRGQGGAALPQATGVNHSCFFNPFSPGQVRCVGANAEGQLGDGSTNNANRSVVVWYP